MYQIELELFETQLTLAVSPIMATIIYQFHWQSELIWCIVPFLMFLEHYDWMPYTHYNAFYISYKYIDILM